MNTRFARLQLIYSPPNISVKSVYGELTGYKPLDIKTQDRSLIDMVKFTYSSYVSEHNCDDILIANFC